MIDTQALKQAYRNSGLKKAAVADKMGLTVQTLTRKMDGDAEFTVSQAQEIGDIFGLDPEQQRRIFFATM